MRSWLPWLAGLSLLAACIERYPAPSAPPLATAPYSASAVWREIELPSAAGDPLPASALRLAIGPSPSRWYADDALVVPREAAQVVQGRAQALALLSEHAGPIVLLLHAGLDAAAMATICAALRPVDERVITASGLLGHGADPAPLRDDVPGLSRDPLGGQPLASRCAGGSG